MATAFLQADKYEDGQVKYCKYKDPLDGKVRYYRQTGCDGDSPGLSTKDHRLFQSILGMTGWLQTTCRPDISLAQSRIAQHSACPSESAMQALLELVAYLITTKSWGIRASLEDTPETTQLRNEEETRQPDNPWAHFSDTDHNREIQNKRRSQNCYIACHRGMPVARTPVTARACACH